MWPWKKKHKSQINKEEVLQPGRCECGHIRSVHKEGKGKCFVHYPPEEGFPYGGQCACQIYIRDKDNDNDPQPETPSPSELERMLGINR